MDKKEPPISPAAWVKQKNLSPEQVALVKEAVAIEQEFRFHTAHDFCNICDVPLTDENRFPDSNNTGFNTVCTAHGEYKNHYDRDAVRKKLGIPLRNMFDNAFFHSSK